MSLCKHCGSILPELKGTGSLCPTCLLAIAVDSPGGEQADFFDGYEIMCHAGEGGMGSVFLAEQNNGVRREVALKVLKAGLDSVAVLRRFETERQILAAMAHPNIATFYDAGVSKRGYPFFAMEFVDGDPITTVCDLHALTIPERLTLFVDICQAIQHAHRKGIVHRDIKPSNVLVNHARRSSYAESHRLWNRPRDLGPFHRPHRCNKFRRDACPEQGQWMAG